MKPPFPLLCTERWQRPFSAAPPEPRGQDNCAPFFLPPSPPPFLGPSVLWERDGGEEETPKRPLPCLSPPLFAPAPFASKAKRGKEKSPGGMTADFVSRPREGEEEEEGEIPQFLSSFPFPAFFWGGRKGLACSDEKRENKTLIDFGLCLVGDRNETKIAKKKSSILAGEHDCI